MEMPVLLSLPVILIFGVMGYRDGVIKRVIEILGVLATLLLTARFAATVNPWMVDKIGVDEGPALLITWAAMFLAGLILSRLLAKLLSKMIRLTILGWLDKWGGALVGVALGVLVVSVLLVAISQVPGGDKVQSSYEDSAIGRAIFYMAPNVYQQGARLVSDQGDELWQRVLDEARQQADDAVEKAQDTVEDAGEKARDKAEEAVRDAIDDS